MSKTCTICGQLLSVNALAGPVHSRKHKNEFERAVGRPPENYDEVRELFENPDAFGISKPTTLEDFE